MRLEIKNGAKKLDVIKEETRKIIESDFNTVAIIEGGAITIEEISMLYKTKGGVLFEKSGNDLIADIRTKSRPADNFTLYMVLCIIIGLFFMVVGAILFPLILWYLEENERKKSESEMSKSLLRAVRQVAERQKLEIKS